jgi:hypothetical protein
MSLLLPFPLYLCHGAMTLGIVTFTTMTFCIITLMRIECDIEHNGGE